MSKPPIPHEHGAWFMLYVPLFAILLGMSAPPLQAILLILTVTGAFFGQHTAVTLMRKRATANSRVWFIVYAAILALSGLLLMGLYTLYDLIYLATPATIALCWLLIRSRFARKRIDRTLSGELLAIAGLTLTAPAAYTVATGQLTQTAIGLWGLYVLYFGSSVFYVKMRILSVQKKSGIHFKERLTLGSGLIFYHAFILGNLILFYFTTPILGKYLLIGFAPVILRALYGWITLSNQMPNLKRIGLTESAYTLWFSIWVAAALHIM